MESKDMLCFDYVLKVIEKLEEIINQDEKLVVIIFP